MKEFKFFAVTLVALTMFSCSKEEEGISGNNVLGKSASFTINVTGEGNLNKTRVAGATPTEVAVSNCIIFLVREGGELDCPAQYRESVGLEPLKFTGTTAAKKAYVVANTGELAGGLFKNVSNETELKKVAGDLIGPDGSTQTEGNLWMAGENDITYGTGVNETKGTTTIALHFVSARIELVVKDNRINKAGIIEDKEVVLLFAGKEGKFFGDAASVQTEFYSGDVSYPDPTPATKSPVLSDEITKEFTLNPEGVVSNYFYTFGNDGMEMPTILAIKSQKTQSGGSIYYPIQFTANDANNTIVPGNSYKVTITLNGDVANGGGNGVIDPEEPSADISLTIETATWTPKTVDKEFN